MKNFSIEDYYGDKHNFDKIQKWCVSGIDRSYSELLTFSKNIGLRCVIYSHDYDKLILLNGVTIYKKIISQILWISLDNITNYGIIKMLLGKSSVFLFIISGIGG